MKKHGFRYCPTCINNKPRKILGYKSALQVAKEKGLFIKSNKEINEEKKGISTVVS